MLLYSCNMSLYVELRNQYELNNPFLLKDISNYTGIILFNNMGLTTQLPYTREICTNVETNIKRKVKVDNFEVILRKPITNITDKNVHYLEFVDVFRYCDLLTVIESDKKYIKEYINKYKLTKKEMLKYLDIAPRRVKDNMFGSGIFDELKNK